MTRKAPTVTRRRCLVCGQDAAHDARGEPWWSHKKTLRHQEAAERLTLPGRTPGAKERQLAILRRCDACASGTIELTDDRSYARHLAAHGLVMLARGAIREPLDVTITAKGRAVLASSAHDAESNRNLAKFTAAMSDFIRGPARRKGGR